MAITILKLIFCTIGTSDIIYLCNMYQWFLKFNRSALFINCIVLCFLFCSIANAQTDDIDSLKKCLTKPQHDTTRLNTIALLLSYTSQDDNESDYYNAKIYALVKKNVNNKRNSEKLNDVYLSYEAFYYNNQACKLARKKDKKAIAFYTKSIELFHKVHKEDEANYTRTNKAIFHLQLNNYKEAILGFFEALKYFEQSNDQEGITFCLTSLGSVYHTQKNYTQAINYHRKALSYFEKKKHLNLDEAYQKAQTEHNIGFSYFNKQNYDQAAYYFKRSLIGAQSIKAINLESTVLTRLGDLYKQRKNYKRALDFYKQADAMDADAIAKADNALGLGTLYYELHDLAKARSYLRLALKLSNNSDIKETAMLTLYSIYKETKQFEQSLEMLEQFNSLKDSAKLEETTIFFEEQRLAHEFEKKILRAKVMQAKKLSAIQLENERKNTQKNTWLFVSLFIILLLSISILFFYKFFKQRNIISAKRNNELKQQLLLSQMNPHFIFNSIDNIQSLIHLNHTNEAINYLTRFSKLTRQILENSTQNHITLEEEVTMLDNFLSIQQLLYNNSFSFEIEVIGVEDNEFVLIPPMLVQPFVENAIKHGLKRRTKNGTIKLTFTLKNDVLLFEVIDNGVGLDVDKKQGTHRSLATKIVLERLLNYTKNSTLKIENRIESNAIVGVRTTLEIPYFQDL